MSQSKRKKGDNRSIEKAPESKARDRDQKGRWTGSIIALVVIVLIAVIIGVFYYQNYLAPFRRTIITVDDITIDMGYFIKRMKLAGVDSMRMLETLTNEQVIKLAAPQYVGKVSPEDIDQELMRIARGGSENISGSEFKEWYRQRLNETGLSDSEYREITTTRLLAARLQNYLAERMPTIAEQVHLQAILLETYEDAVKIRARWEAGEDFADLAREASLDEESKENGGDLGWVPRGILPLEFDYVVFNLGTDNVSEPIPYTSDPSSTEAVYVYYLLIVSEKADARELDEASLQVLRSRVLESWLPQEIQFHKISYNYNSEIVAWIGWQLAKEGTTRE